MPVIGFLLGLLGFAMTALSVYEKVESLVEKRKLKKLKKDEEKNGHADK